MSGWDEQSSGKEREGIPTPRRPGNARVFTKCSYGGSRGSGTPRMGGDRCIAAQRAGTAGEVTLSRARTVENLTIVVDKIYTQDK